MNTSFQHDSGAYLKSEPSVGPLSFSGNDAIDAVAQNGKSYDMLLAGSPRYQSIKAVIPIKATMASGSAMTITGFVQDSADDSTFANLTTVSGNFTLNALDSGAAQQATFEFDGRITDARRYIRIALTAAMDGDETEVAVVGAEMILGGAGELPDANR